MFLFVGANVVDMDVDDANDVASTEGDNNDNDYFESAEYYEDLKKAQAAARKAKAEDLLLEWIVEAESKGDDTDFYEQSLADLEKFVAENEARLDEILREESLGGSPADFKKDNKNKKKEKNKKRGHNEDKDKEELEDSENAGPPKKKQG